MRYRLVLLGLVVLLIVQSVSAEDLLTLGWSYDTRQAARHLVAVDLDGDGLQELVAGAYSKTNLGSGHGLIYVLEPDGVVDWMESTGGFMYSMDAGRGSKGIVVSGLADRVSCLAGEDVSCWSYFTQRRQVESIHVSDLDGDGYVETLAGVSAGWRGNLLYLISEGGTREAELRLDRVDDPYALHAVDLDGDSIKEVVVGTAPYSKNTATNTTSASTKARSGRVYVLSNKLESRWSFDSAGSVNSLDSGDLDGDGSIELLVGAYKIFYLLDDKGDMKWHYSTRNLINDVKASDLDGDGKDEVVLASDRVYVLDSEGKKLWEYNANNQINSLSVDDLDGDGLDEVVAGADRVYILSSSGKLIWKSDSFNGVMAVASGDFNNDSFLEVASASLDSKVRLFTTEYYLKTTQAGENYEKAEDYYDSREYELAKDHIRKAVDYYNWLNESTQVENSEILLSKIIAHIQADSLFNESNRLFGSGDYKAAELKAGEALQAYRDLGDAASVMEANTLLEECREVPLAGEYINKSRQYFSLKDYANASFYASKAVSAYSILGDQRGINESQQLSREIQQYSLASVYYTNSYYQYYAGDYSEALVNAEQSAEIYRSLGDSEEQGKAEHLAGTIRRASWMQTLSENIVLVAGFVVLVILVIAAVIAAGLGTLAYRNRHRIVIKIKKEPKDKRFKLK